MINDKTKGVPDFIGIGAQRAGTSWLYNCLKEHSEVYMPQKEVHYFDLKQKEYPISWYLSLFEQSEEEKIKGEITPDYMFSDGALDDLKRHCPSSKLIILLRNPMKRSYSAYSLFKAHGRFQGLSFQQAIDKEPFLFEQSLYSSQISKVNELFPKEQVFIDFYENISKEPNKLFERICIFLNINSTFKPESLMQVKNSSAMSNFQGSMNIITLQKRIENSIFKYSFEKFKKSRLANVIKKRASSKTSSPATNLNEAYKSRINEDLTKLESMLKVNLSHWRV